MRFSITFSIYLIRNFLRNFLFVFLIFAGISFVIDFLELIRESQGKGLDILKMILIVSCKIPFITYSFLPFIFLFGSILTFTKLNNNYELTAIKSAGLSVWSIGAPVIATTFILSIFFTLIFQPVSALLLDNNTKMGEKYLGYKSKRVSVQNSGIWLYDQGSNPEDDKIIKAQKANKAHNALEKITIYIAGENLDFKNSYFAKKATLSANKINLEDVKIFLPGQPLAYEPSLELMTNLSSDQIHENIPNPDIIKLWQMPGFIKQIEESGFSALKHRLYFQTQIASPLLYISLVLIAFICSLSLPRQGKHGKVFVLGGGVGIFVFFINKIFNVLVLTSVIPIMVGVIAPSIIYLLSSFITLIHFEE